MDFWLEEQVDGFFIRDLPYLVEDSQFRDNPVNSSIIDPAYTKGLAESYQVVEKIFSSVIGHDDKYAQLNIHPVLVVIPSIWCWPSFLQLWPFKVFGT